MCPIEPDCIRYPVEDRVYWAIPKRVLESLAFEAAMGALSWDAARHEAAPEGWYAFSNLFGPSDNWQKTGVKASDVIVVGRISDYNDWLRAG